MKAYDTDNNFYQEKINEDAFITLIKKETWLKEVFPNAVYLKNSFGGIHWSYYIYFYSKIKNICYINDLSFYGSVERLSVTNTIEQLSSKILPFIKMIQNRTINKKFETPKFIYFHNRWYGSNEIVRQAVNLKPLYNEHNKLYGFCEPDWKKWNIIINSDIDSWNDKDKEILKRKNWDRNSWWDKDVEKMQGQ